MAGREIVEQVLDDTPEMLWQSSREEAADRLFTATESIERVEVEARDPEGHLIGFATASDDDDPNVGPSLGIQHFYISPEHRGSVGVRLLQELIKVARKANYTIIGYTRRIGEGRFQLHYMRLSARRTN